MLLVTFLGTGRYQPVTYAWQDGNTRRTFTTHLFPLALAAWFQPERIRILVTPEARESEHWVELRRELGPRAEAVEIAPGRSEAELWQLFDTLASAVPKQSRIVLDVTHGYRSLPLFATVAALLLRRLHHVEIERVLYAAFEARRGDEAPVFDLTPLVDLAEWLAGIEALERTGDGRLLADRLREIQARAHHRGSTELPRRLQRIGQQLNRLSRGVWLNRPLEALHSAHELQQAVTEARDELSRWAPPFALLADRITAEIKPLAAPEPQTLTKQTLEAQLALIEYALQKGLLLQAVTLAREWLVSWHLLHHAPEHADKWLHRKVREEVELTLNDAARSIRKSAPLAQALPDREIYQLWAELTDLRNDLAHCGMRASARSGQRLTREVQRIIATLRNLWSQ